jgi:hypothetical protein
VNDQQLREKIMRMVFVAEEIKKSIYTHTATGASTAGIVLLFVTKPPELRFPLPTNPLVPKFFILFLVQRHLQ